MKYANTREPTHACAVCPKLIGQGHLMCLAHWRLVPHAKQQAVYRTWRHFLRVAGRSSGFALIARSDYFRARDAAIEQARGALAAPAGPAQRAAGVEPTEEPRA